MPVFMTTTWFLVLLALIISSVASKLIIKTAKFIIKLAIFATIFYILLQLFGVM